MIVEGFVGPIPDQVRVIGEAAQPRSVPYRADMTVLDAMIAVGGLTRYAGKRRRQRSHDQWPTKHLRGSSRRFDKRW